MALEFERKYLVLSDEWRDHACDSESISQGYIADSADANVRIRVTNSGCWLTIKGAQTGIARPEFEYAIPQADAQMMLELFSPTAISKTRHTLTCGEGHWTVDVFHGNNQGLVLLEVETTEDFFLDELPAWVGDEVTQDARFKNVSLSRHPFTAWADEFDTPPTTAGPGGGL